MRVALPSARWYARAWGIAMSLFCAGFLIPFALGSEYRTDVVCDWRGDAVVCEGAAHAWVADRVVRIAVSAPTGVVTESRAAGRGAAYCPALQNASDVRFSLCGASWVPRESAEAATGALRRWIARPGGPPLALVFGAAHPPVFQVGFALFGMLVSLAMATYVGAFSWDRARRHGRVEFRALGVRVEAYEFDLPVGARLTVRANGPRRAVLQIEREGAPPLDVTTGVPHVLAQSAERINAVVG